MKSKEPLEVAMRVARGLVVFGVALSGLVPVNALGQSLESTYKRQRVQEEWRNSCSHWKTAEWENTALDYRIKIFPDGRLFQTLEYESHWNGLPSCLGSWGTISGDRMGSHTRLYKDGSGLRYTIKVEGDELVSYSEMRLDGQWSGRVLREVLGKRIATQKTEKKDSVLPEPTQPALPRPSLPVKQE
mgnify:CR=1 FL=1